MLVILAGVAMALTALAGCGGAPATPHPSGGQPTTAASVGDTGHPADALKHPCARLSAATVGAAVNLQLNAPTELDSFATVQCDYTATSNGAQLVVAYTIGSDVVQSYHDARQTATQNGTEQDVTGIGDQAFFQTDLATLYVLKGNRSIVIGLTFAAGDPVTALAEAKQLAPVAIAALP
jgi:hypothetical protein